MKVVRWRIRSSGGGIDADAGRLIVLEFVATRTAAIRELERVRFRKTWTLQALFGLYIENYEARYRRRWPFTAKVGGDVVADLKALVDRVGLDEAKQSIQLIFTMRWITEHRGILANRDLYARFIIPELDKANQARGEPGQWTGTRQAESREVTADEFFNRG